MATLYTTLEEMEMQYRWWRCLAVALLVVVVSGHGYACVGADGTIPDWGGSGPNGIMLEKLLEARAAAMEPGLKAPPAPPILGSHPVVIILLQNANAGVTFNHSTRADWANRISEIAQYYTEVSNGKFTVTPATENDSALRGVANDGVIGPVNISGLSKSTSITGSASKALVVQGIRAINPYINFASYDTDHNGTIEADELHLLVYQAGDEASFYASSAPKAWAHMLWQTPALSGLNPSSDSDGMRITSYCYAGSEFNGNQMASMGVMTHELGHDIGLPDLYDVNGNWDGLGSHCLMSSGSWGGDYGDTPVHLDGFFKSWLGWANVTTLTAPGHQPISLTAANGSNKVLRVNIPGSTEFFIIENRQQTGFDAGLPGSDGGIAIYHCDGDILTDHNIRIARGINDAYWNPGIQLEEADGAPFNLMDTGDHNRGSDDDYFRAGNNTQFGASSSPSSRLKNGNVSGLDVNNISASGAVMTFNVGTPVNTELHITTHPAGGTRYAGQSLTFTVAAAGGTPPYRYQWQKNGANIGTNSAQYSISSLTSADAGSYKCIVTDSATPTAAQVVSNTATIAVTTGQPPILKITAHPKSASLEIGESTTLSVSVTGGVTPYHYQWKKGSTNVGANSAQLQIGPAISSDAGSYRCIITDSAAGQVTSSTATIQVLQRQSLPSTGTAALILIGVAAFTVGIFRLSGIDGSNRDMMKED